MTQPLIFLVRPQQVDTLAEIAPDFLSTARLISLDLDVSARLAMLGYDSTAMTDVLPAEDIYRLRLEAVRLSETWFLPYIDLFTYDGYVLPYLDRFAMAWFFTEALIARELFRRCVGDTDEIVIIDSPRKLTVWGTAPPDAANAVWRWMGEGRVKVVTPHPLTPSLPQGERESKPKQERFAAWRARLKSLSRVVMMAGNWLLNPRLREAVRGKSYDALMFVYYLEASRYSAIAESLERAFGNRFAKMTTDYGHRVETGGAVWNPMPTLRPYWITRQAGEGMRRAFEAWKAQRYEGSYPELFANPHLHFKFRHFITEQFPQAVETTATASFVMKRFRPKTIIVTSAAIHHQPQIIAAAGRLGIPVMTVPHSGIPTAPEITLLGERGIVWTQDFIDWWGRGGESKTEAPADKFGINFDPSAMPKSSEKGASADVNSNQLVTSELLEKQANSAADSNRIVMVGLPKAIVLHGYEQKAIEPPSSGKKTILALLSAATLDTIAHGDMVAHWEALKELANVPAHLRETVRVIFKIHPGADYQHFYEQVRQSSATPDAVEIVKNASLLDLVRAADLCLSVNIPTSAYLLPLEEGKPLLHVQTIALPGIRFALGNWQGASVIREREMLWPALEKALDDPAAILDDNRRFWAWLGADSGDPLGNLQRAVGEMVAATAK
jgi:hypothetical protein